MVWAKNGGVWAKIEKVGTECMFVGKGEISLGKEILFTCLGQADNFLPANISSTPTLSADLQFRYSNAVDQHNGQKSHEVSLSSAQF